MRGEGTLAFATACAVVRGELLPVARLAPESSAIDDGGLRRELASDGEANSRQSGVRRVVLGVRLDLSSPFDANSRRMAGGDRSNRPRRRAGSSPSLTAGVSASHPDRARTRSGRRRSVADGLSSAVSPTGGRGLG